MESFAWAAQPAALIALCGVLGLLVGSFLNVVILRLPRRLEHDWRSQASELLDAEWNEEPPPDLVLTRSHCPHCRHSLSAMENIPLLSWFVLRGRCRHCGAGISIQYPIVELLTAIASMLVAWRFGFGSQLAAALVFSWILIAAAGIDVHTQLLPDQLTLPLLWIGLLISIIPLFTEMSQAILGAAIGYLSLWTVFWVFKLTTGKEGMGYGDFKLLGALGAWMGTASLLPIILLSSLVGAVVGGTLLALRAQDRSTPIPFGPFIAGAGWLWLVFGDRLGSLYAQIFMFGG